MTTDELRATWFLLGLLLFFLLAHEPRLAWYLIAGLPWLMGLGFLIPPKPAGSIARVVRELAADKGVRIAAAVLIVHAAAIARIFTVAGALIVGVWVALIGLSLAAWGRAASLRTALLWTATSSSAIAVTFLGTELVLRQGSIPATLGLPSEIASWEDRYDRIWECNVFGFRSRHEEIRKGQAFRILALGDSFTWGDKVADSDSTWPAILERELGQQPGMATVEVISMAQRGYTTANEAELLQRLGWQFDPDLVIVQFFANDALPSFPDFGRVGGEWLCPQRNLVPALFRTDLIESSAVVALLERLYNAVRTRRPCYMRFGSLYSESSSTRREFETALDLMADSARARQTPVLMALFPYLAPGEWTATSHPLSSVHRQVAEIAEEKGLLVLDLAEQFADAGGNWRRWWATQYDSHPSSSAHRLVALALARFIMDRGLAPLSGTRAVSGPQSG
jgi:lysophospholipase L1-like esterase